MGERLDIAECRERCGLSIRNTHTGRWLVDRALEELEHARTRIEELERWIDTEEWRKAAESEPNNYELGFAAALARAAAVVYEAQTACETTADLMSEAGEHQDAREWNKAAQELGEAAAAILKLKESPCPSPT